MNGLWSERCYWNNQVALSCTSCMWDASDPDALTRAAISVVTGRVIDPMWSTGALIGALSIDECKELARMAEAFGADDATICAQLGAHLVLT
jgi:hypothetical protein